MKGNLAETLLLVGIMVMVGIASVCKAVLLVALAGLKLAN